MPGHHEEVNISSSEVDAATNTAQLKNQEIGAASNLKDCIIQEATAASEAALHLTCLTESATENALLIDEELRKQFREAANTAAGITEKADEARRISRLKDMDANTVTNDMEQKIAQAVEATKLAKFTKDRFSLTLLRNGLNKRKD